MFITKLIHRVQTARSLDPIVEALVNVSGKVLPPGPIRDVFHGKQLGHALHPMLVALPIGFNVGATFLDVAARPAGSRGAERLTGAALIVTVPTVLAGLADWSSLGARTEVKRVGIVHAGANAAASLMYTASWFARRRGHYEAGMVLSLLGGAGLVAGGYLGGHLAYVMAVGVNRNADAPAGPSEWTDAGAASDLGEGLLRIEVEGQPVVLVREGGRVHALSAVCSHLGGPLDEGDLEDGCLVCPWHGSEFEVATGKVLRGPATVAQPIYEARVAGDRVQVRAHDQE